MKKLFLAVLIGIMGLASCSKDDPGNQTQNLRWSRVDLTGAKYLVLSESPISKSTGAPSDVFKVDENGNMTAVVFYFTYDNNGNSQQARTNVKVVPQKISSYDGGQYMLFHDCYIRDEQGQNIHLPHYGSSYSFLIRRKDGAVFHIPYSEKDKFPATNSKYTAKVDHNGDLFVCSSSGISKVEAKEGQTYLRQITPNGMGAAQFMLTDQTDVLLGGFGIADNTFDQANGTVFYPNGGFEQINFYAFPGYYEDRNEHSSYTLFQDGNQVKLFECSTVIRDPSGDIRHNPSGEWVSTIALGIRDLDFSTTPPVTLSNEYTYSKTWTENRYVSSWRYSAAISCKNHFILTYGGRYSPEDVELLLVCDRTDKSMRFVTPTQFPELAYGDHPLEESMIDNTLFYLNTTTRIIQKYDFETLTYSEVQYDDSSVGQYVQLGISLGYNAYIINGVRNSDGRSVVIEINHSTGAVKTTVAPDERKITELIQLN